MKTRPSDVKPILRHYLGHSLSPSHPLHLPNPPGSAFSPKGWGNYIKTTDYNPYFKEQSTKSVERQLKCRLLRTGDVLNVICPIYLLPKDLVSAY